MIRRQISEPLAELAIHAQILQKCVPKCVPIGYTSSMAKKDVAFKIRVEEELRRDFVAICRIEDRPAAQVVREFMRNYIASHSSAIQGKLFGSDTSTDVGGRG